MVNGIKTIVKSSCCVKDFSISLSFLPDTSDPAAKERCELILKTYPSVFEYSISCDIAKVFISSKFPWDTLVDGLGHGLTLLCAVLDAKRKCRLVGISTSIPDVGPDICEFKVIRTEDPSIFLNAALPPNTIRKNIALSMMCIELMSQLVWTHKYTFDGMRISPQGDKVVFYRGRSFCNFKYNLSSDEGILAYFDDDGETLIEKKFNLRSLYRLAAVVNNACNANISSGVDPSLQRP